MAVALFCVGFYISNPQAFGGKGNFNISNNGHVAVNRRGVASLDLGKIGSAGTALFGKIAETVQGSPTETEANQSESGAQLAENTPETADSPQQEATSSQILSAIEEPDLTSYNGRLAAIYTALNKNPDATGTAMHAATKACLKPGSSDILVNYFVQMVQLTAKTAHRPVVEQADYFKRESAPLTNLVKIWLGSLPTEEGAAATAELQNWAGRPIELVACNMAWLQAE
jgi:hypothetical protein